MSNTSEKHNNLVCGFYFGTKGRRLTRKKDWEKVIADMVEQQNTPPITTPVLSIKMDCCDEPVVYKTFDDIPLVDAPCP